MPRVTLGNRLETLTTSPFLSQRDKEFASSLLAHYNLRKSLTSGRRVWVDRLEAKAAETEKHLETVSVDGGLIARIDAVLAKADKLPWGKDILDSMKAQVNLGKSLSEKQLALIAKFEADVEAAENFVFTPKDRESLEILVSYYAKTSYWTHIVQEFRANPDFVPAPNTWRKLTGNKYAQRVLEEARSPFRFAKGSVVQFNRSGDSDQKRVVMAKVSQHLPNVRSSYRAAMETQGMILDYAPGEIQSACKGAKQYKVLFFGCPAPILVEERWLKKAKKAKK